MTTTLPGCGQCLATSDQIELIQLKHQYLCTGCLQKLFNFKFNGSAGGASGTVIDPDESLHPTEIKAYLDKYIIGQDQAKKVLSVAIYNHSKRLRLLSEGEPPIDKSNILMVGPTGSGKTFIVKTIADLLDVPFVMSDATGLVQAGYVGRSVEECIQTLYRNSGYDVAKAQSGIVFIDEIDKLARKGSMPTGGRDVSGEGVQQGLLKLLEGTDVTFTTMVNGQVTNVSVNTSNILFICGGAFVSDEPVNTVNKVIQFGMIPEFVGRLPVLVNLQHHDIDALVKILTEPKNSLIDQIQRLFAADGVTVKFTKDGLEAIAAIAHQNNTGARGLRTIVDLILLDELFEIGRRKRLIINREYIEKRLSSSQAV